MRLGSGFANFRRNLRAFFTGGCLGCLTRYPQRNRDRELSQALIGWGWFRTNWRVEVLNVCLEFLRTLGVIYVDDRVQASRLRLPARVVNAPTVNFHKH